MTRGSDDRGTVMILALGAALLAISTLLVLADTSSLFMRRTALMTVADNAAIAAAQAIDVDAIYQHGVGSSLPLDPALARALAADAVAGADDQRLRDIRLDAVEVAGDAVTVTVSAAMPSPIGRLAGDRTLRIRAAASAVSATRP